MYHYMRILTTMEPTNYLMDTLSDWQLKNLPQTHNEAVRVVACLFSSNSSSSTSAKNTTSHETSVSVPLPKRMWTLRREPTDPFGVSVALSDPRAGRNGQRGVEERQEQEGLEVWVVFGSHEEVSRSSLRSSFFLESHTFCSLVFSWLLLLLIWKLNSALSFRGGGGKSAWFPFFFFFWREFFKGFFLPFCLKVWKSGYSLAQLNLVLKIGLLYSIELDGIYMWWMVRWIKDSRLTSNWMGRIRLDWGWTQYIPQVAQHRQMMDTESVNELRDKF